MASLRNVVLLLLFFFLLSSVKFPLANHLSAPTRPADILQTYVVHVTRPDGQELSSIEDLMSWYRSFLPEDNAATSEGPTRILYAYQWVTTGFAARLTRDEVSAMKEKRGFVAAHLEKTYHLQTTHSAQFLGLPQQIGSRSGSNQGKGIIIGVLDTGVWPRHPSFNDSGMPPPPAKWKGRCDFKPTECSKKVIGSRAFGSSSPIDKRGHGTMTASIAAGAFVESADVLGNAKGTAVGMAPKSHLAIYKVCSRSDCSSADILAGLDAAVSDGVNVLSISLGAAYAVPLFEDPIAIGTFAAIQKGLFVSCGAGNAGPARGQLANDAPWMLTVGASSIDRSIVATVKLGNGVEYDGESLYQPQFPSTLLPLVYPWMKHDLHGPGPEAFKHVDVKGKIVLSPSDAGFDIWRGEAVKKAGGAAMILMNEERQGSTIIEEVHVLPTSKVDYSTGQRIIAYINSTKNPTATIVFKGTVMGNLTAPAVSSFSSRGPSLASPGILKPDIIGPGLNILAASSRPQKNGKESNLIFNIDSGTSFSCPHLSGIAALVKRAHPHWTPAALKSAIMTSAGQLNLGKGPILDERLQPADVFAIGAGHVNPQKAINPGLVYDIQPDDYIPYLCGLGYTDEQVSIIAHQPVNCSEGSSIPKGELNYPSFSVVLGPPQTFTRTVTNVGEASSSYVVTVVPPQGAFVGVKPAILNFSKLNHKAKYSITFSRANAIYKAGEYTQGYLKWDFANYTVRSPISVKFM